MTDVFKASEYLCSGCVDDYGLEALIDQNGVSRHCSSCLQLHSPAISFETLAVWVKEQWARRVECVSEASEGGASLDWFFPVEGESAACLVARMAGVRGQALSTLVELMGLSQYESQSLYRLQVPDEGEVLGRWISYSLSVRHGRRFFSEYAWKFWEEIFSQAVPECIKEVRPGDMRLFRARLQDDRHSLAYLHESAIHSFMNPPSAMAREGRMNPAGISYLYAARERETCVAEMRPAINDAIVTAELEVVEPLKLLDISLLRDSAASSVSVFDPQYDSKRLLAALIGKIHQLISRPAMPWRDHEYLPTQLMAEYLSHVYQPRVDGVVFGSSQCRGGQNVVLFPESFVPDFELAGGPYEGDEYDPFDLMSNTSNVTVVSCIHKVRVIPDSLKLHRVEMVDYRCRPGIVQSGGGVKYEDPF